MKNKKIIYLVDVNAIVFRSFYALPPMQNNKKQATNALFGFLKVILKLLKTKNPTNMVFCMDTASPSFRKKIYSDYKANRKELDPDLGQQLPFVEGLSQSLGICTMGQKTFEADDIIGSLATSLEKKYFVVIVSGDKDFAQLINKNICMYDIHKEIIYDPKLVFEKWGVKPEQMVDYLAIVGDSSDNIPGIKGIGAKGAAKLLSEFKNLKGIYNNLDKILSESIKKKLLDSKEMAFLSQRLATIDINMNLPVSKDDYKLNPINEKEFKFYTEEFNFKNTYDSFMQWQSSDDKKTLQAQDILSPGGESGFKSAEKKVLNIAKTDLTDVNDFKEKINLNFSKSLVKDKNFIKDLKSISFTKQIKKVSLQELKNILPAYEKAWVFCHQSSLFIFFGKTFLEISFSILVDNQMDLISEKKNSLQDIGAVLEHKQIGFKSYDIKNLWRQLKFKKSGTAIWDNQLAAHISTSSTIKSWEDLCFKYLEKNIKIQKEVNTVVSAFDILQLHLECELLFSYFLKTSKTENIFYDIEMPLLSVLYDMENKGILIDKKFLLNKKINLQKDIDVLTKKIHQLAGETFNVASPKQLANILFEKLSLPSGKKTKMAYSTASLVLEGLKKYEIVNQILDFRELNKLQSTYVVGLLKHLDKDCVLHTEFNQSVTSTGRLSSSNPNLQNIPIKTKRGRLIRKAFIARPNYEFIAADYSQIELRILAHLCGDKNLCKAFINNEDVHCFTASKIFNISLKAVSKEQRQKAKAVNFGISYGQGIFGLAENLRISRNEANDIIKNYHSRFPMVQEYMESLKEKAYDRHFSNTILGRRRYLPDLLSNKVSIRKFAERAAINAPMQGSASDLIKLSMIKVANSLDASLLLQVHDELIIESLISDREDNILELKNIMESIIKLKIPLKVNISYGKNWMQS